MARYFGHLEGDIVYISSRKYRIFQKGVFSPRCQRNSGYYEDENNMELHISVEDDSGLKEFQTVKTKKDATLGSSLENALGGLVCYDIIGPDLQCNWNTLAVQLKGKQLSLKRVPYDDSRRDSIYGTVSNNQYPYTLESSFHYGYPITQYPTNIPVENSEISSPQPNFSSYGPGSICVRSNSPKPSSSTNSLTERKEIDTGSCSSLTQAKLYGAGNISDSTHPVLKHSQSIDDTNFKSLSTEKNFEKDIIKDLDCNALKKCNSMSDIQYDPEPLKKFDSVTSMDTSEEVGVNYGCGSVHCNAEKCTHNLIWENGRMTFSNQFDPNASIESSMDTANSLEICTFNSPEDDYIPHSFVLSRRTSSELSSPLSPINSPPKGMDLPTSASIAAAASAAPKPPPPCEQSLLRTALRRSFEKKASETGELPNPKPCKKAQPQQNEMYLSSVQSDSDYTDSDTPVTSLEEELSKRPAQCRLPVSVDGYIAMGTQGATSNDYIQMGGNGSGSENRPTTLPIDSTYMNMAGGSPNLARRPLPPRPRETKSYPLVHSHSVGDTMVLTPDNEYCYISDEDQTTQSKTLPQTLPPKKRVTSQPVPIQRSQSSSAIPDLSNVPGWCASISEGNVSSTMNKYKNEDGNFMVWRMKDNTFVITVSHLSDLRHYAIHCRNINGQIQYYIFPGGYMTPSILDLLHHYMREGLKGPDPQTDPSRGKKWQKFSHVKLKHPMKSRSSARKSSIPEK
ncbi:hypothetical protein LOTGIDRAFT_233769 [Lottia gigantea]|uniref:SH2 domain-containing protein n=1 Tax=Lottia gigantea TaxID=225164 RepID=V4BNN6_LOTGI|nr:hypothetical protein LOTGIDRAFT_233769 [Lottia gigantea]ESO90484.1 hypothetical protein LOTGIDRAFT_233769 [Lottia gigantea]